MPQPRIAQKAPYEMVLEPGRYFWCRCGRSSKQPFCDGSHKDTGFTPIEVLIERTEKVWFCGCKHTRRPPYCDGTHKTLIAEN